MTTETPAIPRLASFDKKLDGLERDYEDASSEAESLQRTVALDGRQTADTRTKVAPKLRAARDRQSKLGAELAARKQQAADAAAQVFLDSPHFKATLQTYAEQTAFDLEATAESVLLWHSALIEGIGVSASMSWLVLPDDRARLVQFKSWLQTFGRFIDLGKIADPVRRACEVVR
jgi:hypothetical protein